MMGDDEGSSPTRPEGAWSGPEATADPVIAAAGPTASAPEVYERRSEPEARPGSAINAVTAGLGIVALALAVAVFYLFSVMPSSDRLAADEKTLSDLRSQVAAAEAKTAKPDLSPLMQRLDASDAALAGVKSDLSALQQRVASLPPSGTPSDADAQIGALAAKLPDMQHSLDAVRTALDDVAKRVDAFEGRLASLDAKVAAVPVVDLGPLTARIDNLDQQVKPLTAEAEATKSAARVTEARQNGSGAEARAAPLAVTAQAVLRAIDTGHPFTDDLKALRNLGADPAALQPLAAVADAGAPTPDNLRSDLAGLRDKIVSQGIPAPSGSYLDRLMAGAGTIVSVRPLGSVPGDSPSAIVARMDDELGRDELSSALADWQKLPDASRAVSKALAERIRLRQEAQGAARTIAGSAIKAMAAAAQ